MAEICLFTRRVVGPHVLKNAHTTDAKNTTASCILGNTNDNCISNKIYYCNFIVYPIPTPMNMPIKQLTNTSTNAS
jgi:hypothetical protein